MSGYNIEYFLADFANRTISNNEHLENPKKHGRVFEVTQLINSLLGLLAIPTEYYWANYSGDDKELLKSFTEDYREIQNLIKQCDKEHRYYSNYGYGLNSIQVIWFIKHIRNAVCHGGNQGLHFFPITEENSESDAIKYIIFYDNNKSAYEQQRDDKRSEFYVKLSIDEIKGFSMHVSNLFCKFEKEKNKNIINKQRIYKETIDKLEALGKDRPQIIQSYICEFKEDS